MKLSLSKIKNIVQSLIETRDVSRKYLVLLLSIILLVLSACIPILSIDEELKLGANENWVLDITFLIPAEVAPEMNQIIQEALNENLQDIQSEGVDIDWESHKPDREGNIPYVITMKGGSYDQLNDGLLGNTAVVSTTQVSGKERLVFKLNSGGGLVGGGIAPETFTLQGGRVLETNGNKLNNNTVMWDDSYYTFEAVMEMPSNSSLTVLWIILIAAVLAGSGYYFYRKNTNRKPSSYPPVSEWSRYDQPAETNFQQRNRRYCPNCGNEMPAGAIFCPNCGKS